MTGSPASAAPGAAPAAANAPKPMAAASGERIAGAARRRATPPKAAAAASPRNAWRRVIEQNKHISRFLPPHRSRPARRYPTVAEGESGEPRADPDSQLNYAERRPSESVLDIGHR